jgi:hypothetical protein
MSPYVTVIAFLLTPFWGYLLWRRMKKVQAIVNNTPSKDEKVGMIPTDDTLKTENDFSFGRSLSFDDDLAAAERKANEKSIFKDLEGRRH